MIFSRAHGLTRVALPRVRILERGSVFRDHLKNVYKGLNQEPPDELGRHIVPRAALWTFTNRVKRIQPRDRLTVRTNCPGTLSWRIDASAPQTVHLAPAGGVMAGLRHYHATLGPFGPEKHIVRFSFRSACPECECHGDVCCIEEWQSVEVAA